MAIVPNYKRSARLTPRYQRNIEVSASAEHMGAAIGRGLTGLGQGIGTAGKALHAAARLDNAKAQSKEREQQDQQDQMAERERQTRVKNQLSESMEKNRADIQKIAQGPEAYADDPDLKDFGSSVDDMRRVEGFLKTAPKDEADNIRPGMEAIQVNASNRANQLLQEQALKNGQQADERYLDNFVQEAVTDRNDPAAVEKYRLAGLANIRASAERDGLDDTEAAALAHAYSSKLDKNVVLAKLEDDLALALDDYDQLRPRLIETDRQELDRTFSFVRKEEEVKGQISGILSLKRHDTSLSVSLQASMPAGENDQPSGSSVPLTYLNLASPSADLRLDHELTPAFATNLDAMMEDAPQNIREGLEILADQDRASIKPGGDQDYWRAQQGQNKVLIRYQGQSLSKAPGKVQDWLADNSAAYGLFMPVGSTSADSKSPEARIADGFDRVLVASLDGPSSRALGPSAKQMEEAISAIDNPDLQEATRTHLQINLDRQSKQDKAGQLNASRELWAAIDDGKSLEDVPISIRVAAGSATIVDATDFIRAREGGKIIQTDAVTLSELNRMMALNPDRFTGQDLDAYRNQINRNDLKELKQHQTDLLKQDSQALKKGEIYKATFEQADQLLLQLGRSATGPDGEIDPEAAQKNAQFLISLKNLIDHEWAKGNFDAPEPGLLQSLIQKQLAADFPDQAADLQALQDVSSSVSTSDSPTVWETIKTESADVVAGIVETFFERYEEDPEGFHNGLRLLDPFTEGMRATGLLEDENYKQIAQAFDDASGEAITAVEPYLEELVQKVERGEIDPNDTLVVAAGSLGAALLTASKKDRVRIIKATRSPFTRLIDAVKRKAQGPKNAPSAKSQVDNGPAPNRKQTLGGAPNNSGNLHGNAVNNTPSNPGHPPTSNNTSKQQGGTSTGTFNFSNMNDKIATQRQYRHIKDQPLWNTEKGSYFHQVGDAQKVLDAARSGKVEFLGTNSKGDPVVRYNEVTGFNNNFGFGFSDQPTNVFIIKGTKRPSVVPTSPTWRKK